ncbi:MAG: protoheme IX farnesyltransferase [Elusimicrobia bacterium]|nr:protoheme IX farnesyltransferase [Elusimicrobiota bacterium]
MIPSSSNLTQRATSAPHSTPSGSATEATADPTPRPSLLCYLELTKPRLSLLVLATTLIGFDLASRRPVDVPLLLSTLLGTALAAGGASALNQVLERDVDAKMHRTASRPLPAGRLRPDQALAFGVALSVTGILFLTLAVNLLTGFLAAITLAIYLFLYTPLKQKTSLCTPVGAIAGAIPPLIGWAARRGELTFEAWGLFWIVFLWQLPHFLALAWMYREDYARAGFPMLPVVDPDGRSTSRQILLYSLALVPVSLLPTRVGLTGSIYFWGALILSVGFLAMGLYTVLGVAGVRHPYPLGFQLLRRPATVYAKRLFLASVVYLPGLLALMALNKL